MSRYDILFESVKIGPVTAPNRFYAVPHATGHGWSEADGAIAVRGMKAEGGWGVVSSQITEIGPDSDLANHQMDRIWDERDIATHAKQVEAVKAHGALAAIELAHGGMRSRNYTTGLPVPGKPPHSVRYKPDLTYCMSMQHMICRCLATFYQSEPITGPMPMVAALKIACVCCAKYWKIRSK